ncbi:Smr/MutS family protein [Hyphomonas sp. FCG-A18]|uniref:Smr/MutS family protein n=1 Tax=Hyphomonas sp. FCG-A18 TaxID=3080019 RepID=UPI002B2BE24A|nr:Smr/MutS family protein [Hyphomonas sp. FCG-A18]
MTDRKLTDQERRAWEAASRHVRRLDGKRSPRVAMPDVPGSSPMSPSVSPRSPLKRLPAPVQNRENERRIRRGKQAVSASFDLHGMTQDEAWRRLPQFLSRQRQNGAQCVIIITGKGRSGDGVLRRNFLHWIEMPQARSLISGYAPAHARHGGGGAWYVFLRKL